MKLSVLFLAAVALPGYAQIPRNTAYAGVSVSNAFTEYRSGHDLDQNAYGFALQPTIPIPCRRPSQSDIDARIPFNGAALEISLRRWMFK